MLVESEVALSGDIIGQASEPLLVKGHHGLGDTLYQRPFLRAAGQRGPTWIITPWPELYGDLDGVQCVRPQATLRTQQKHLDRIQFDAWAEAPSGARLCRLWYNGTRLSRYGSILEAYDRLLPIGDGQIRMDQPFASRLPVVPWGLAPEVKVAVIRPVTLRREWLAEARAPQAEYVAEASWMLKDMGYFIIAIADLEANEEWLVRPEPFAHDHYYRGELKLPRLLGLLQAADLIVGGVGFIVPGGLVTGTPTIIIGGGLGAHNAPEVITSPRVPTSDRIRFILPDRYCRCTDRLHDCDKGITGFPAQFEAALVSLLA